MNDTPRVDTLIDSFIKRFPGMSDSSNARYFEAIHQEITPLARKLERETITLQSRINELETWQRTICELLAPDGDDVRPEDAHDVVNALRETLATMEQPDAAVADTDDLHIAYEMGRANRQVDTKLMVALENCRIYAARNRHEEWGKTIIRFLSYGGVTGSVLRNAPNIPIVPSGIMAILAEMHDLTLLSEGQIASALNVDRITCRKMLDDVPPRPASMLRERPAGAEPDPVDEVLDIVDSYGPWGPDINTNYRFQIILADEVKRLRAEVAHVATSDQVDLQSLVHHQRPAIELERKAAEQEYSCKAFDYAEAPIGSRDWTLYWAGWLDRSTATIRTEGSN